MNKYRFVGAESVIGEIHLKALGQPAELSAELANEAVLGGCAILPEETFAEIGFTEAECKQFAYPAQRTDASAEFAAKHKAALIAVHGWRESLATEAK